jgi:hypothetical protein
MDDRVWRIWEIAMTGGKLLGEKPVPSALRPPQIPQGFPSDRTRSSAVRDRQIPSWAAAWPKSLHDGLITVSYTMQQDGLMKIFSVVGFIRRAQSTHYFSLLKNNISWIYDSLFLPAKTHSGLKESDTVSVKSGLSTAHGFNSQPRCPEKFSVELNL